MDKTITTALLIIISMIMALMLFNSAYPAIVEGGGAIANLAYRAEDRMRTRIAMLHIAGELDSSGTWQDCNMNGEFDVFIWVKNIGSTRLVGFEQVDVFFGPEANFTRIPHENQAAGSYPYWTATVEGSTDWIPTATLRITVHYATPLSSGRHFIRISTPNGVTVDDFVGL